MNKHRHRRTITRRMVSILFKDGSCIFKHRKQCRFAKSKRCGTKILHIPQRIIVTNKIVDNDIKYVFVCDSCEQQQIHIISTAMFTQHIATKSEIASILGWKNKDNKYFCPKCSKDI